MRLPFVVAATLCSLTASAASVALSTEDGVTLRAESFGAGPKCVVLIHDAGRSRADWTHFAERLSTTGFRTLTVDLRGHGDSTTELTDESFVEMTHDVAAAVSHLRSVGCTDVSLVGARLGANLALNVAAQDPEIRNVVLLSTGLSIKGVRVASALGDYGDRPALFVASSTDTSGAKAAQLLAEKASGDTHVALLEDAGVGTVMLNRSPELEGLMISWLNGTYHAARGENAAARDLQTGEVSDIETTGTKFGDR